MNANKEGSSMGKHTPGPWWCDVDVVQGPNNEDIATVFGNNSKQTKANASLIAAAPEMLSALKNLVERCLIKDVDGEHYDEVLDVIAKAEGRA